MTMTLASPLDDLTDAWTPEIDMLLSSLDAGWGDPAERRAAPRQPYRTAALLRLFSDTADSPRLLVFTRDVDPRGLGFITQHRLPLGFSGRVELQSPQGGPIDVGCTVYRCRPFTSEWFEGSLSFIRPLALFEASPDDPG
jgi:hypothetical protein